LKVRAYDGLFVAVTEDVVDHVVRKHSEVFTCEVAKRWVKAGHEVTLFASEFPNCKNVVYSF
jgi:CRISPR/Cas system CMR-associated protein Cmr3 (group 5 of RAMP superfamily)